MVAAMPSNTPSTIDPTAPCTSTGDVSSKRNSSNIVEAVPATIIEASQPPKKTPSRPPMKPIISASPSTETRMARASAPRQRMIAMADRRCNTEKVAALKMRNTATTNEKRPNASKLSRNEAVIAVTRSARLPTGSRVKPAGRTDRTSPSAPDSMVKRTSSSRPNRPKTSWNVAGSTMSSRALPAISAPGGSN